LYEVKATSDKFESKLNSPNGFFFVQPSTKFIRNSFSSFGDEMCGQMDTYDSIHVAQGTHKELWFHHWHLACVSRKCELGFVITDSCLSDYSQPKWKGLKHKEEW